MSTHLDLTKGVGSLRQQDGVKDNGDDLLASSPFSSSLSCSLIDSCDVVFVVF